MHVQPLTLEHMPSCLALSTEAGWNQTATDWAIFFACGESFGCLAPDGRLIATTFLVPYRPRIAWISMVLVDPSYRRRGVATRLV